MEPIDLRDWKELEDKGRHLEVTSMRLNTTIENLQQDMRNGAEKPLKPWPLAEEKE